MFERFFNFFRRGGAKLGMVEHLNNITDHQKIGVKQIEYTRIAENERIYGAKFKNVEYINSHGVSTERPFKSINVAKIVARKMAKLVFNEGVSIDIEQEAENDFIQDVFNDSRFIKNFGEQLEAGYAIGGLVLRPYVDTSTGKVKISFVQADSFYPLETNTNDITEGAIAHRTVVTEGKKTFYYTLLEFHEWNGRNYQISNELYQSEYAGVVGVKVPLTTLDKYAELEEVVELENFTRPVFVYIKLAGRNNIDLDSPLSLGIIDNSKKQFIDINEKYDQFMWEVSEAGRKIIASDEFFKVRYDGNGKRVENFDNKTSVFHKMRTDDPTLSEFSPALRQEQFIETINFILRIIELQTGLSSGTFSFDGQSVKTATEVVSENSETYATRSDNILIVEQALKELIITIFDLAAAYELHPLPEKLDINIDFDDGVFQSQESKLEYYGKATTYQLIPKVISMQRMYGISEDEAGEWLKMINAETMGADPLAKDQQVEETLFGEEE
ncbi:phage portal protein [Aerococcus viridans]